MKREKYETEKLNLVTTWENEKKKKKRKKSAPFGQLRTELINLPIDLV